MIYLRPAGGEFCFTRCAMERIDSFRQRDPNSDEAGGVLLGRILPMSAAVIVDQVTTPGHSDRRSRFRFFRAMRPTQKLVNNAWAVSDGTCNYLGEWHTHPEDDPQPSATDRKNWLRLTRESHYEQTSLFFVIAGRELIRAWEVSRHSLAINELIGMPNKEEAAGND